VVAPFSGRLVDRFGGKYFLMTGLVLFATGTGLLFCLASPDSSWQTFVPPLMLAGLGMGCVFAPMTTIAMRDVTPRETGAASGVFNTMRQLGAVVGSAVIGAVLQAQLAIDLPAEASSAASGLPAQFRDQFVSGFAQAARGGFQVGVGQTGGAQLPPNLPAQVAAQIQAIARAVFERGFVDAMRPSAVVAIVVLLVAAAGCAFIATSRRPAPAAERGLLHRVVAHGPDGPNRSVRMRSGLRPARSRPSAVVSTSAVGPHTNARTFRPSGFATSASIRSSMRRAYPLHPAGCDRVSV